MPSKMIRQKVEGFCEYCQEPEQTPTRWNGWKETILTMQPDHTITCSECGQEHNHKHQIKPVERIFNGPTPLQISNAMRREEAANRKATQGYGMSLAEMEAAMGF